MKLIKNYGGTLDSRGYSGAVLMDLSKAYVKIDHEQLIANPNAYCFRKESLELILDYFLTDGKKQKFVIISGLGLNFYKVFHTVLF